jgi:hypothetical protein
MYFFSSYKNKQIDSFADFPLICLEDWGQEVEFQEIETGYETIFLMFVHEIKTVHKTIQEI